MYNTIKKPFIFILLVAICQIKPVQAMQQEEYNLTEIAEKEIAGKKDKTYISREGLVYKSNRRRVNNRIEHIKQHLNDVSSKEIHTFFNQGTEAHKDIIGFIDNLFIQFRKAKINTENKDKTQDQYNPTPLGEIALHGKQYNISELYDGNDHRYTIIPANTDNSGYPPVGTNGGSQGDKKLLYGYKLVFKNENSTKYILTFYPC